VLNDFSYLAIRSERTPQDAGGREAGAGIFGRLTVLPPTRLANFGTAFQKNPNSTNICTGTYRFSKKILREITHKSQEINKTPYSACTNSVQQPGAPEAGNGARRCAAG
jgi:hypothetical protein